ncbi:MAG: AAA family ATPase, partial [Muribaculaceae bacterium]|nr:AAA family ATPase [Muribaculaceae bacterium]
MAMAEQKYPVGIESFEKLREYGMVYVDKTELIYRLVEKPAYIFLSRPRRFGKSLLLSTIAAFFEGRSDLFKGLAISRYVKDWVCHPIFHINFVNAYTDSEEGLTAILNAQISHWEEIYGKNESELTPAQRFYGVIRRAVEQTGQRVVVLIDEYDKFLVATIDNPDLNSKFRAMLKPLYATLKAADPYIRFAMITGVTRFSQLSIFSDLNNLKDISLNKDYGTICGISETEIKNTLMPGVEALAHTMNITTQEAFLKLKENYDGYHFTRNCPDLYNPFSLLNAFEDREISDYWFASGTPAFLLKILRRMQGDVKDFFNTVVKASSLAEISSYSTEPESLLFQTGYLTIKEYNEKRDTYTLAIPNEEVERGLMNGLLPIFAGKDRVVSESFMFDFISAVEKGDPEKFLRLLQSFLADIPYDLSK